MRRPSPAQLAAIGKVVAECKRLGAKCCKRPDGIADRTWWSLHKKIGLIRTVGRDGDTPLVCVGSHGIGWLHAAQTQAVTGAIIRVPAKFYDDHEERDCEPFCTPVKRTSRFVWLRTDDEGLDELLDDARHYADEDGGPDAYEGSASMRRSAAATVAAIENLLASKVTK